MTDTPDNDGMRFYYSARQAFKMSKLGLKPGVMLVKGSAEPKLFTAARYPGEDEMPIQKDDPELLLRRVFDDATLVAEGSDNVVVLVDGLNKLTEEGDEFCILRDMTRTPLALRRLAGLAVS